MKLKNYSLPTMRMNYYLTIQRMLRKVYLLKLNIENENLPLHVAIFTSITILGMKRYT
jgi:hypothetical protein